MEAQRIQLKNVRLSLADLVGAEYVTALCEARAFLEGGVIADYRAIGEEKVDFFPAAYATRLDGLLPAVGQRVVPGIATSSPGAATIPVNKATKSDMSPIGGMGFYRVGEDGRLYLIAKSEHYHAPLGHDFPGYACCRRARGSASPTPRTTTPAATSPACWKRSWCAWPTACPRRSDRPALDRRLASQRAARAQPRHQPGDRAAWPSRPR